jgi:YbgC/YbaW family acyl-CoA thioester hydrolase
MGAATTITRRLEWSDTDASGVWHYSTLFRYAEAAEAQLHRELGISDRTFGHTPRVRVEGDYKAPVRFDDVLDVTLRVGDVGRASVTYDIEVMRDDTLVAKGRVVSVLIDAVGHAVPWPDELAAALRGDG